jgi:hypothetical protein
MTYVEYTKEIYKFLSNFDSTKNSTSEFKFNSIIDLISQRISPKEIVMQYKKEIGNIIDQRIAEFGYEVEFLDDIKKLNYYEKAVGSFTIVVIFWILHNNINFSDDDINKLTEAIFIMCIGYKFFDMHLDRNLLGKEAVIIGNYLINTGEQLLYELFFFKETSRVINRHRKTFTEVEFLEKRNRWKATPFSWEKPEAIGYKASPLFIFFELLFIKANINPVKIDKLIEGLTYWAAALQLSDDFKDAFEDISVGIESLHMSGFFEKYGRDININPELVNNFLDENRHKQYYIVSQSLFEKGRNIFTEYEDDILLLYLEFENQRFNSSIKLKKF